MSARHLTSRVIRRALDVVDQLPAEALADLVEALLNKMDAADQNPDGEPDDDAEYDQHGACDAGDDDPRSSQPQFGVQQSWGPGDPLDAEPSDAEAPQHFGREVLGMESWTGAGLD